jgi:hypothetical protein
MNEVNKVNEVNEVNKVNYSITGSYTVNNRSYIQSGSVGTMPILSTFGHTNSQITKTPNPSLSGSVASPSVNNGGYIYAPYVPFFSTVVPQNNLNKYIIPPQCGWESHTYYLVEASFNENDPIDGYIFYSGELKESGDLYPHTGNYFLPQDMGKPGVNIQLKSIDDALYMKVNLPLTDRSEIKDVENKSNFPLDVISKIKENQNKDLMDAITLTSKKILEASYKKEVDSLYKDSKLSQ